MQRTIASENIITCANLLKHIPVVITYASLTFFVCRAPFFNCLLTVVFIDNSAPACMNNDLFFDESILRQFLDNQKQRRGTRDGLQFGENLNSRRRQVENIVTDLQRKVALLHMIEII